MNTQSLNGNYFRALDSEAVDTGIFEVSDCRSPIDGRFDYIRRGVLLVAMLLGCLMLVSTAWAASFDCGKAQSKVEHLICDNAEISKLDDELSVAYKTALQKETQADTVKQAQKQWMKERNGCVDVGCVKAAYDARLATLSTLASSGASLDTNATEAAIPPEHAKAKAAPARILPQARQQKTIRSNLAIKETYALVMSKNDEMCNHMRQLMEDDLHQFGRAYDSNDGFVSRHEEFTAIPWKPARASYVNGGRTFYTENLEGAVFDLNNDGVLDFVVKDKSMLSGIRVDRLFMLDRNVAGRANTLTVKELFESTNQIGMDQVIYMLSTPLEGRAAVLWLLSPFIYHDISYVYMQSLYKNDEAIGGDFVVIAKYFDGKFKRKMTGKMEDICYMERVEVK